MAAIRNVYVTTRAYTIYPRRTHISPGTHTHHVQVCALEATPPKHCFAEEDVQEVREHTVRETGVVLL